ncbi:hypothetical protein BDZ45DRAFT_692025 [Acephala macrosclerotiorum]|nr:hypothetical protein BDZ45DRAFT_692025 [Acephala macrosclerotiorum]
MQRKSSFDRVCKVQSIPILVPFDFKVFILFLVKDVGNKKSRCFGSIRQRRPSLIRSFDRGWLRREAVSRSNANLSTSSPSTKYLTDCSYPFLSAIFEGQDAIVCAYNPAGTSAHHKAITDAALASGIKHFITPELAPTHSNRISTSFRCSCPNEKLKAIPRGIFWLDSKSRTVTIFGSGNQNISMSSISMVGRATVEVFFRPEQYTNRPVYFADYTISNNELLVVAEEVTKEK